MTTIINAVSGTGLTQSADASGQIKIQSNGVTTNALAWVNFNGVTTATIRASFNVSSVTRNSTGDYTVNFTNAMPDANYSALAVGNYTLGAGGSVIATPKAGTTPTASAIQIFVEVNGSIADLSYVNVSIFR